jgi:LysR family transcriptional regulator, cell division regulator
MLPSSSEIRYFIEVSQTLNISRAAERLGISQPTLSVALKRLEDSLATPLLVRGKTGVQLTRSGLKFSKHARALLDSWERLKSESLGDQVEAQGQYTIGCHASVGLYSLHHFLPELNRENPKIEIKLVHDLSRKISEDVISFKIDFGIVVNPPAHPDLVIKQLFTDEVGLWCRKDGRSELDVLICDPELLQSQRILKAAEKKGIAFRRMITTSSLEVVTSLTAAGAGIGLIPGRVASASKAPIKTLSEGSPTVSDRICLIYRQDMQKSAASRKITECVVRNLSP